jgi:putative transposase
MLMCDATGLSQRRACRLTGLSLSTCRYEAHRPAADAHLSGRITELALERRRFGYRIWQLLRREGFMIISRVPLYPQWPGRKTQKTS